VKHRWVKWTVLAALAATVAFTFLYPRVMISPGLLLAAHADLADDCFACHAPLRGAASERCIDCHVLADIGLRSTQGKPIEHVRVIASFHQALVEQDCMACHGDHQGAVVPARSRKPFTHELLKPELRQRCEGCHAAPRDALHRRIKDDCQQCHDTAHWKPATFEHDELFLLDRDHDVACHTCHTGDDFGRYTCYGCHEHRPAKMRAVHREEGIRDFENCVECHRSAEGEPEGREREGGEED
jgi:Class III cytochrome C family